MLHPRVLKYLDEVSRSGSIRKAGEKLNVAPSAINRQIIALERQLGLRLFERLHRRMRPTAAGEALVAHARSAAAAERRVLDLVTSFSGGLGQSCAVATVPGLAGDLLTHTLASHRSAHPATRITVRVTTAEAAADAVASGDVEVAFAFDMPRRSKTVVAGSIASPCGAVAARDHPLADRSRLHLHEMAEYPLLLPPPGVTVRDYIDNAAWRVGIRLEPALESDDFNLLRRFTRFDHGIAVLNRVDVVHRTHEGSVVFRPIVEMRGFGQELTVVHAAQSSLSRPAHLLVDRLVSLLTSLEAG